MEKKDDMKDLYSYEVDWPVYSLAISERQDRNYRYCVSSYVESKRNYLEIVELDMKTQQLQRACIKDHPFPATKIMFLPSNLNTNPDLLTTSADFIRVYRISSPSMKQQAVLDGNKKTKFCGPLTSFDWCRIDLARLIACSVDTTITYFDMKKEKLISQLIAHDKEVFDVSFQVHSKHEFTSCGADSTVRLFDIRNLNHSTLLYENKKLSPVLRVKWNKLRDFSIALLLLDSTNIVLIDKRMPTKVVAELSGHSRCVNSIDWAPHSGDHLVSGSDDLQTFVWDTSQVVMKRRMDQDPVLGYSTKSPVNQVKWSHFHPRWVILATNKTLDMLRV